MTLKGKWKTFASDSAKPSATNGIGRGFHKRLLPICANSTGLI